MEKDGQPKSLHLLLFLLFFLNFLDARAAFLLVLREEREKMEPEGG